MINAQFDFEAFTEYCSSPSLRKMSFRFCHFSSYGMLLTNTLKYGGLRADSGWNLRASFEYGAGLSLLKLTRSGPSWSPEFCNLQTKIYYLQETWKSALKYMTRKPHMIRKYFFSIQKILQISQKIMLGRYKHCFNCFALTVSWCCYTALLYYIWGSYHLPTIKLLV